MASDAVTLITNDHRIMEQLFDKLRSGTGDRQQLLDECAARLTAHSHAEEQVVYPELAEIGAAFEAVRIEELAVAGIKV